jgi:hypothetical protein
MRGKPMPTKTETVPMPSFAQILADMDSIDHDPIELSELPPLTAAEEIRRTQRTLPIPDLTAFVKLWQLTGEGNTGKTLLARWLIEQLIAHDKLGQSVIAALAPGNRNLVDFAPGTMQPPSSDALATANWATKRLLAMQKARWGGVWDFGGGDTSQRLMIQAQPDMADQAEQEGLAIVAAYLFSPRLDDLAFLKTYERMGFRPRATVLILNRGKADRASAFNDIRRQPEYRAALDRGAVEIWLPALPQSVALAIEKARVTFSQARDGEAPAGKREAAISLLERVMVREWMMAMDAEFRAIESWLPWT